MEGKNEMGELKTGKSPINQCAGRQHARDALKASIIRLESELSALRTLEKAITWSLLNDEQEQDLWAYFVRGR